MDVNDPKSQIFIQVSHTTNIEHSYWEIHYIRGKRHTQKQAKPKVKKLEKVFTLVNVFKKNESS